MMISIVPFGPTEKERRGIGRRRLTGSPVGKLAIALAMVGAALSLGIATESRAADPHIAALGNAGDYPSATMCASCHGQVYEEWRSSNHAYASISPMFHKFEQKINDLAQGTIGDFCVRCHASVGTTLGESRAAPLWERAQVSREGVTCITCHRVNERYGKVNGDRLIRPGNIHDPVYGPFDGDGLKEVVDNKDAYKVRTDPSGFGLPIHGEARYFEQISKSDFCVSCHQVAVHPGIKLEVVWEQFRASPAYKDGTTCQDCHMGLEPGTAKGGYGTGPVAFVNGKAVRSDRKHSNHAFYGPGYTIAHPGIFPHSPRNNDYSIQEWLEFDYRSEWGVKAFEDEVAAGRIRVSFPEAWEERDDRYAARDIVDSNLKALEYKRELRRQVMNNGSNITGPFFKAKTLKAGKSLAFHYLLENINPGHNLPSGSLGAQPELWLNVALTGPGGDRLWESGYIDSNGDMADLHSLDVAAGTIEHDDQLFNLQTKFLTTNVKGTDREMYLPVNMDVDQLPFIRPGATPNSVLNHPPFIRMEGRSLPPLSERKAKYKVPGKFLKQPGKYKLSVRLRSRAEPIYFMTFVGATEDMKQAMNEWMVDIHPYTVEFELE